MEPSEYERDPGRKFAGLALVILLHVLVGYVLVTELAHKTIEVIKRPIETKIIEEVKPPPPPEMPPPPPPPKMVAPPPPFIPPPEVQVATPPPQNTITVRTEAKPDVPVFTPPQPEPPAKVEAPPAKAPSRVSAVIDFSTCTKPEYPRSSYRNEEQGTVTLGFKVGLDGYVKEAKVEKTSGFKELDKAALHGLSQCKFKPALIDGKPTETWSSVKYVWRLEE